jgi:DNA-binding NtrC family response regulator
MGFLHDELAKAERRLIEAALVSTRKDAEGAAVKLGIPLDDLVTRARRLGIPLVVVRRKHPRKWTPERRRSSIREATRALERRWILEALEAHPDSVRTAAASINMAPSRFYRRLEELRMSAGQDEETARRRRRTESASEANSAANSGATSEAKSEAKSGEPGNSGHRDFKAALDSLRTRLVREALDATSGDVAAAARRLGVSRSTLYRMQRSH